VEGTSELRDFSGKGLGDFLFSMADKFLRKREKELLTGLVFDIECIHPMQYSIS